MARSRCLVRNLGRTDYRKTWEAMKEFTDQRGPDTPDELWLTEHAPIFTQGLNGRAEHLLAPGAIPVLQIDRGGQVTYHGPGQLVVYCLLDITRLGLGVKSLVSRIERSVIELLEGYRIAANTRPGAPGVYVDQAKVAALGLRIRKGCCYHGLSLNVDMDLEPFSRINPCGYRGLAVTQLRDLGVGDAGDVVGSKLAAILIGKLGEEKSGSSGD
ncbi:MAG: lipoyl(octanoyl) transferase LipB [Gammaproteobacteria bacterium]|nr:lipoyl(octanoyl) transferase LipB [Gammaproteobacteria bacterium]MDH3447210.1 lipoyl(octanoyl) transferase LipB [Gammaproteobacteria bacterium]